MKIKEYLEYVDKATVDDNGNVVFPKEVYEFNKELIEKYGNEAVKPIKYRDINMPDSKYGPKSFKTINEETSTLSEWALAGALSLTSLGVSMLLDAPISAVIIPTTTDQKARYIERSLYRENRKLSKDLNRKQPTDD